MCSLLANIFPHSFFIGKSSIWGFFKSIHSSNSVWKTTWYNAPKVCEEELLLISGVLPLRVNSTHIL